MTSCKLYQQYSPVEHKLTLEWIDHLVNKTLPNQEMEVYRIQIEEHIFRIQSQRREEQRIKDEVRRKKLKTNRRRLCRDYISTILIFVAIILFFGKSYFINTQYYAAVKQYNYMKLSDESIIPLFSSFYKYYNYYFTSTVTSSNYNGDDNINILNNYDKYQSRIIKLQEFINIKYFDVNT